jgi:hypothetical protein
VTAGERFVVLGLGQARSAWFRDVARLAHAGSLPIEFVKCVGHEEARVRLESGRAFSAMIVDGGLAGVDRDLLDAARRHGLEVLVVADPRSPRDWDALGSTAVLPPDFSATELLDRLHASARAIPRGVADQVDVGPAVAPWQGALVVITGASGAGSSTVAAALAQGLARDQGTRGKVLLADFALDADQGVLHHAPDVVPGLPELVEAHRASTLSAAAVHSMVFDVEERGYHLLLGVRRRRGWSALRPRALDAAVTSLLSAYAAVVTDVTPDFDGHHECGSFEVEERNALARTAARRASVAIVVGGATLGAVHGLAEVLRDVCEQGVDPASIVTVINHAPRSPRERAELTRALTGLPALIAASAGRLPSPVFVPYRRGVEEAIRGGTALPAAIVDPVVRAVLAALGETNEVPATSAGRGDPRPITPGSLGHWFEREADAV